MKNNIALICLLTLTSSCAVQLSEEGDRIRIVTANQKERCERISIIATWSDAGKRMAGSAFNKALNETALAGGDSFYLLSQNVDWLTGANVTGEALRCNNL